MDELNYELEEQLKFQKKKQKKIINHVSLILLVWVMLVAIGIFVSNNYPDTQNLVITFSLLSIIPVILLEVNATMKLLQLKHETTELERSYLNPKQHTM